MEVLKNKHKGSDLICSVSGQDLFRLLESLALRDKYSYLCRSVLLCECLLPMN